MYPSPIGPKPLPGARPTFVRCSALLCERKAVFDSGYSEEGVERAFRACHLDAAASNSGIRLAGTVIQPSRQPVIAQFFEKLLTALSQSYGSA